MRIQLWSYNYDPEPMGIGPVSTIWAKTMSARGHEVEVVAAHPHYPSPEWGKARLPYREVRDGIQVTRLPLMIGRDSKRQRVMQEISFATSQTLASPFLGTPDVLVSVSPSFPALLPAILNSRSRRVPWVLWLQDILPDGATTTGILDQGGMVYRGSKKLERMAYQSADEVVVLSEGFRQNLLDKGVPDNKISVAYNPATISMSTQSFETVTTGAPPRIICMGNMGRSQGLVSIVRAFEENSRLKELDARLVFTGTGVAELETQAAAQTDRVEFLGVLDKADLEKELNRAQLGVVSQAYPGGEFNVPSKLMNYLSIGLPVVASVPPGSEADRIVQVSGGGWASSSEFPEEFARQVANALEKRDERERRRNAGLSFARENLTPDSLADKFERVLLHR